MALDDAFGERESDAGARYIAPVQAFENPEDLFVIAGIDAGAVIANVTSHSWFVAPGARLARCGFSGVADPPYLTDPTLTGVGGLVVARSL